MKKAVQVYDRFAFLVFLFLSVTAFAKAQNVVGPAAGLKAFEEHFKLMPAPQIVELLNGKGITAHSCQSILLKGNAVKPVLNGLLKSLPLTIKDGPGVIVLNVSNSGASPSSKEGYILEIGNDHVTIEARDQAGIFYGCQTLLQLLDDGNGPAGRYSGVQDHGLSRYRVQGNPPGS
jgi:N-acetyl-beta-hexosaminidase